MNCENCPAGWEDRGYEGECYDCGCRIVGVLDDNCKLSKQTVIKRLKELEDYENGEIDRPQWIINRFIRQIDDSSSFSGEPGGICMFPPKRMGKRGYIGLYSPVAMHYQKIHDYDRGFNDGKSGMEYDHRRARGDNE